jgi:hypothetical protein
MEALIPITMFISIAAVLILRPMTSKVGGLLQAMTKERTASSSESADLARMRVLMEHVSKRMDLMEERLDFTERLLASGRKRPGHARLDPVREFDMERIGP